MTKEEFKKIRESLRLSQDELARKLGRASKEVWRYEDGTLKIPESIEKYLRLIEKYN